MPTAPRIHALVLAAGRGSAFGGNKLLAHIRGEPLLTIALRRAQAACPGRVTLVTGFDAELIRSAAGALADSVVHNPDWDSGMGGSLAAGARALRQHADALLVTLADQPLVEATHLDALIARWSGEPAAIVASRYDARPGVPALFGSAHFDALCALEGDTGARALLRSSEHDVVAVDCPAAALDVDSRDDLARCLSADP